MWLLESLEKSKRFQAELQKIIELTPFKIVMKNYFLSLLYLSLTYLLYYRFGVEKYNELGALRYYLHSNNSNLIGKVIILISILGFIFWLYRSINMRSSIISMIATLILVLNSLWNIIKIIGYCIYKFYTIIFKVTDKIVDKYNKLDEKDKATIKRISLISITIGARIFIKETILNGSNNENMSFVDPHHVDGYTRQDGTKVTGYWRDGDGNPFTTLTKEQGGGYSRKG